MSTKEDTLDARRDLLTVDFTYPGSTGKSTFTKQKRKLLVKRVQAEERNYQALEHKLNIIEKNAVNDLEKEKQKLHTTLEKLGESKPTPPRRRALSASSSDANTVKSASDQQPKPSTNEQQPTPSFARLSISMKTAESNQNAQFLPLSASKHASITAWTERKNKTGKEKNDGAESASKWSTIKRHLISSDETSFEENVFPVTFAKSIAKSRRPVRSLSDSDFPGMAQYLIQKTCDSLCLSPRIAQRRFSARASAMKTIPPSPLVESHDHSNDINIGETPANATLRRQPPRVHIPPNYELSPTNSNPSSPSSPKALGPTTSASLHKTFVRSRSCSDIKQLPSIKSESLGFNNNTGTSPKSSPRTAKKLTVAVDIPINNANIKPSTQNSPPSPQNFGETIRQQLNTERERMDKLKMKIAEFFGEDPNGHLPVVRERSNTIIGLARPKIKKTIKNYGL